MMVDPSPANAHREMNLPGAPETNLCTQSSVPPQYAARGTRDVSCLRVYEWARMWSTLACGRPSRGLRRRPRERGRGGAGNRGGVCVPNGGERLCEAREQLRAGVLAGAARVGADPAVAVH